MTRTEDRGCGDSSDIAEAINGKLEQHGIEKEQVLGIGVGVPAPVTTDGIVNGSASWLEIPKNAKKELEELTDLKAEFGNDANVAAPGEMWKGGGVGYRNMIVVTLGAGVGGGIIINGKILTGENGAGGEIGHMCESGRDECHCRMWRTRMSGAVCISNRYLSSCKKKMEHETCNNPEDLSAKAVSMQWKGRDEVATGLRQKWGNYLGHAMADMAAVLDPAVFVIGGGVSKRRSSAFIY